MSKHRMLRMLASALVLLWSAGARAQDAKPELPTEPILRIETGLHGPAIMRIDTDAANRFAVTASEDKTVRVWSLKDGHLLRVLRLPIDRGHVGKAYAVAISPDGATVAAGGWTTSSTAEYIFLFDRNSGELKQRLGNLPGVVNHLAYSPDGQRLAASLGSEGIRVFDASREYRPLPSDADYGDASFWANFDRSGRLVTASDDGFVRLYAVDRYDSPTFRFKKGRPFSAAFSPDGTRVAVGYQDSDGVVVLSAKNLKELFRPKSIGAPANGLSSVGWSEDSRFLFAGGIGFWQAHQTVIRRWADGGRGAFKDIPSANNTIMHILPLKDGRMLFASIYNFGVIGADAKPVPINDGLGLINTAAPKGPFQISKNGETIRHNLLKPNHSYQFTLSKRQIDVDPPEDASLVAPITEAPELSVTNWEDSSAPAVNGTPLHLDPYELSRSLAFMPGAEQFVLGGDFSLRLFNKTGHEVWPARQTPAPVFDVNVTADGRLIVATYGDGTVRWSRVSDGEEILALFIHPDGQRWILWTPDGYYDASTGADDLIGWHINHGYDRAPDFYPVSQFGKRFYRPDVIRRVLHTPNLDVAEAVREADQAAGQPTARAAAVSSLLTPVVEINDPKDPARLDRTDLSLAYSVRLPSANDILRVEALIDGVKAEAEEHRLVDKGDMRAGILHIKIPRRDSKVSVIAYNDNGASVPASVHVQWAGPGTEPKLTLYVLAIGVSNYQDAGKHLNFAAKDAEDFVALAKAQIGGLYEKVILPPGHESLRDTEATREAVLDGLDWIMRAVTNTNDVAMVFLAGHGMTLDQHYRFLPYDYDENRKERTTISDSELQTYLTKIGGKKIFFFDTCYSGGIVAGSRGETRPNVDKFANELRSAENGIVVFTSSTGNELSLEKDEWNNGAFTKALVEGMRGAAARQEIPVIMISDLQGYVSRRVKELTSGNQRPMMAMPKTVEDFPIAQRLN